MEDVIELDLKRMVQILLAKIKLIVIVTIVFGVIAFLVTYFLVTPMYESSISMYVNNATIVQKDKIDSTDLDASNRLVNTYMAIINSNSILDKIAAVAGLDYTAEDIRAMMTTEAIPNTEIFQVTIKNSNPVHAAKLANAMAKVTSTKLGNYLEASSVKIIDYATIADKPSSPNIPLYTLIGILLGLMFSVALVLVQDMFDVRIKTEEDMERLCSLPILGSIPDMNEINSKNSYSYANRRD